VAAPALDGCLDVDLESSALTNAFGYCSSCAKGPARRLIADMTAERPLAASSTQAGNG